MPEVLFGFDVGNTRVKAGLFRNGQVCEAIAVPFGADLEQWLDGFVDLGRAKRALISTVNPQVSDRLCDSLQRRGVTLERVLESNGWIFEAGLLGCDLQIADNFYASSSQIKRAFWAWSRLPACWTTALR